MEHEQTLLMIYETYPRHRDRREALRQIERALKRLESGESGKVLRCDEAIELLQDRTKQFARSPAGNRGHYTPYPGTWFARAGYLDDTEEWDYITREEREEILRRREANVGVSWAQA